MGAVSTAAASTPTVDITAGTAIAEKGTWSTLTVGTDKYTIVMWIEGEDPECLDVIRGGYVKLMWFFNIADEEL